MANLFSEGRAWESMTGELLAEVFNRLPFEERLRTVPFVCKAWRTASQDPVCWRNVDMQPWTRAKSEMDYGWEFDCEEELNAMVKLVVHRSCGGLRRFRTMFCSKQSIVYIANHCPRLTELSIAESFLVDDETVISLAENCSRLEKLDLSDCYLLTRRTLEAVGRNCPSLVSFSRNMLRSHEFSHLELPDGDLEASAIALHMPALRQLELKKSLSLTNSGLMQIASWCKDLESLNLACCNCLSPSTLQEVSKLCPKLKEFVKPISPRMQVNHKAFNGWMLFD